jgi:phosphoribosylformimino-5-aminoimidazole carboxamide ribotide isomerase
MAEPCSKSPTDFAGWLIDEGASRLALMDLDATAGQGNNRELIGQILQRCRTQDRKVCVQVAGGIRSSDQAQYFLDQGAAWLVVGTILLKSPMVSEQLMARFQSVLTASIDSRGGKVRRPGWMETTQVSAHELAQRAKDYGFRRLLFLDAPKGNGADPDFAMAQSIATTTGLPLVMGGSLSTPGHLEAVHAHQGVKGALMDAHLFHQNPRLMAFLQAACA